MIQESNTQTQPWHKHPWVWALIVIPVISVILSFTMLWVAINNKDPEVEGDWHKNRKAIEQDFSRDNYASALSINADLSISPNTLTLQLNSPYQLDNQARPSSLQLTLSHPTNQAKDVAFTLKKMLDGRYSSPIHTPLSGRYYLAINTSVWRLSDMIFLPLEAPSYHVKPVPLSP